jgi:hypothetical protein
MVFSNREIRHVRAQNVIKTYAVQTNRLDNVNRTKSKKLIHPLSLFVMDEVQKLHNKDILDNCLSTFLRQIKAGHAKVLLAGNPDRRAMWFDAYYKSKLHDPNWIVLKPTYHDIAEWLPDALWQEIKAMERDDPVGYAQIYEGDLNVAGWDSVFHSFSDARHYIPRDAYISADSAKGGNALIQSIVIGVDDAESRDALSATAITVHFDGSMRCQETLYKSMRELPDKPALTVRCDLVIAYLDYIQSHFNPDRTTPVIITFVFASGMYRQMLVQKKTDYNFLRWRNVQMYAYTEKQDKEKQLDEVNAAFACNLLSVVNVDRYSPQYTNTPLVDQIKALRTLENGKIDPNVPNDCTDGLQYAAMTVLRNPYALSFPKRRARYDADNTANVVLDKILQTDTQGRI